MIHDLLPSDVEFARDLLNASRSDAEILTFLASRGIEPARAAQLVDDLRHGREPNFQAQFALGSKARRPKQGPGTATENAPQAVRSRRSHSWHTTHGNARVSWGFVLLVVIFLWALWYAWFKMGVDASQDAIDFNKP